MNLEDNSDHQKKRMRNTTLCFLIRDRDVLLAMKKRGFGVGKWNGVGGKVNEGEEVRIAAVREIAEEIGVSIEPRDLESRGSIKFHFNNKSEWDQEVHIFTAGKWSREPTESDEMKPAWYPQDKLPYREMWADDPHWLPKVIAKKRIEGEFLFDESGDNIIRFRVREIT